MVDDEDFEKVNKFKWCAAWDKDTQSFYAIRGKGECSSRMARFIMDCPENKIVDHENHDTLDNQKHNLRICTHTENMYNRRGNLNSSSVYKGVSWDTAAKKWIAQIMLRDIFNQRFKQYLGCFDIEEEAALAYDESAIKHFGEFAYLNFPRNY